jgi:hypothetical protein
MRFPRVLFRFLSLFLLAAGLSAAQDIDSTNQTVQVSTPIQDNSFLIEEAYNQEDGVIQQISTFARLTNSRDWVYTQADEGRCEATSTREGVAGSHPNVVSFTGSGWGGTAFKLPISTGGRRRNQAGGGAQTERFVPCRRPRFGRGSGGLGLQTKLPISIQHSAHLVSPWIAMTIWIPRARDEPRDAGEFLP